MAVNESKEEEVDIELTIHTCLQNFQEHIHYNAILVRKPNFLVINNIWSV